MSSTKEIVKHALDLPVEDRALLLDSLLKTFNSSNTDIDHKWAETAMVRLKEIRTGRVKPIPGKKIFEKVRERFLK